MNKSSMEVKVGLFFLVGLAVFAYVWFKVLDLELKEGFIIKVHFKSVEGLVKEAQVQIAGIKVGVVKDIHYDPEVGKAMVSMEIREAYRNSIPEGSKAVLKTKGLLGDKYVSIDPGKPNARKLKPNEEIAAVEPTDTEKVFETMGVVAQDLQVLTREARKKIVDEKGAEKIDRIMTNTDVFTHDLKDVLAGNKEKINRTLCNVDVAAADVSQITGRNKEKINRTIDDFEKFSRNIDKTGDKFGKVADGLEAITRDVRSGQGTLGKLVTDDSLHRDAQTLIRGITGLAGSIQNGQGTVGRLINDPEMYYEARRAIRNLNKTAEDISDQTPISTLAAVLGVALK
jgi:phospholipid/cholesterol/gamma-HCH transport system substrate-binding protein